MSSLTQNIESHLGFKLRWIHIVLTGALSLCALGAVVFSYFQLGLNNFFFLLMGMFSIAAIFYNPRVGLYLSVFIVFSGIVWGFEISDGFLIVVFLTGISWLIHVFVRQDFSVPIDKQMLYIAGFMFFALFSCCFAYDPFQGLKVFVEFLKLAVLYFLVICIITEKKQFITFLKILSMSVILSILFGFYNMYTGLAEGDLFSVVTRIRGLTGDPNILANHALLVLPMFFLLFLHYKTAGKRLLMITGTIVLILGIVISFSRSGSIGLFFIMSYFFWRLRANRKIFITGLLLITIILFLIPSVFWQHLTTLSDISNDPSLRWRARLYVGAASLFLENPLTGIGLGNFVLISNQFFHRYLVVHNTYLEIAVETGIFGLIMFLLIIFFTFQNFQTGIKSFFEKNDQLMVTIGKSLVIGLIAFLITAIFLSLQTYFVLWIIISLSVVYKRISM